TSLPLLYAPAHIHLYTPSLHDALPIFLSRTQLLFASFTAIRDFLRAAWFLWSTPLLAALSSALAAALKRSLASSVSPSRTAVSNFRTKVRTSDLMLRLRSRRFALVRIRLIADGLLAIARLTSNDRHDCTTAWDEIQHVVAARPSATPSD